MYKYALILLTILSTAHASSLPDSMVENSPTPHVQAIYNDLSVVGATSGAFRVDESGAATYSLPLQLPRGIAGNTPELSLNYHSQAGNGLLGIGWSIGGLSRIDRCRQTPVQDGAFRAVTLSKDDRFCLDGQRLMVVTGIYGAPNSVYATEIDSQVRVTALGGSFGHPDHFEVRRADGSISFYGKTLDSRFLTSTGNRILSWSLSEVTDQISANSNRIHYHYSSVSGEQLIDKVTYSGNTVTFEYVYSLRQDIPKAFIFDRMVMPSALLTGINVRNHANVNTYSIQLEHDNAPSSGHKRLKSITECGLSNRCLKPLILNWYESSGASIGFQLSAAFSRNISTTEQLIFSQLADMNGDGFTDWVYATKSGDQYKVFVMYGNGISMSSAQQVFSFSIAQSIFDNMMKPAGMEVLKLVDINGDGKTDFLFFEVNTQRAVWSARLNQFNGTSITTDYYSAISTDIAIALHDFNGNGLPDLLTHNGIRYNTSKEYSYSGTSLFGQLNAVCYRKPGVSDPINTQCGSTRMNFGFALTTSQAYDLNHDGLNDLVIEAQDKAVYLPNTYWAVFDAKINDANQLEFMLRDTLGGEQTIGNDLKKLYVLDMNNDGQSDYLYHDYNRWHIAYNSQSVPKIQTLALSQQLPNPDDMHFMQFLDLTGSGVPDIVYYHNGWKMLTYPFTSGPISVAGPTINTTTDSAQFVDMRGNGKPALVVTDFVNKRIRWFDFGVETETYPPCYPHCLPCTVGPCDNIQAQHMLLDEMSQIQSNPSVSNSLQDKIKAFTTGHQLTTSISYGFLNNTALQDEPYQNQSFTSTPGSYVFKLNGAIPVVSKVLSDTGQGITGVAYQYGEAFVQSGGRGFLGFSSLVTVDLQSGVKTRTRYRLGFPYIGLPMTTEQWSGNVLLSESRNVYSQLPLNGSKTVFPYAHASFEDNYQLNTNNTSTLISQIKTEQQYVAVSDSYVELREMRVYTKDVVHNIMRQVLTVNSYQQDNLSRWLINRLTRSTVTHQQGTGSISLGVASINPDPTKTVVRTSTFSYNGNGQLVEEVIEPEGNNEVYLKTVHSYDAVGNRTDSTVCSKHYITNCGVSAQQNLGERIYRSSTVLFDNDRRYVTSLVQNGVEVAKYSNFNALGQAQSVTENGIVSIRRFNAFGQPVFERTQTIAGAATGQYRIIRRSYIRSAVNLPANAPSGVWYEQVEQGGEPLSWSVYDAAGRVLASITQGFNSGEFRFQLAQYDELGRVTHQSQPGDNPSSLHWNVTEFDNLSRIKQVTAADGTLTSFNYSGASTTQTVTNFWANAIGQSKTTTKNAFGELLRVVDAAGTLRYEYDAAGNLLKATGVDSHSMVQAYNSRGFKKSMQDPDSGNWLYSYNALGELISQTDPRNHITLSYYDAFGRKYNEEIRHGQSLLRSVSWGFSDGIHAVRGLLTSETVTGAEAVNISKLFDYDSFGRLKDSVMFIDGETLTESFTYDQFGRVFQQFDASGDNFGQQFEYQNGYVKAIWEARYGRSSPNSVRYQLFEAMDAYGNVTQSRAGNGRSHWRSYDTKTGLINSITTSGQLQQWTYQFDGLGNLRNRKDALHRMRAAKYPYQMQTLDEYFEYDMLNRLTEVRLGSITSLWLEYANNGNIRYKSDVRWDAGFGGTLPPSDPPEDGISPPPEEGTWTLMGTTEFSRSASEYKYGIRPNQCNRTAGPRAVSQIGTQSYCYDTMGNQTRQYSDGTLVRQIDYGAIGKPSRIRSYNTDVANNSSPGDSFYTYDGSRNLVKRHVTEQGSTKIFYQHGGVELIIEGSERRFRRTFANAIVERSGNSITTSYVYTDHLGSVDVITNAAGQLLEKLSFDAFGKRRQVYTAAHVPVALSLASILNKTSRGFTGHLQVDHASIVHMGGRIYDSHIGRFLQADPFVQSRSNSQNFNRYSYVLNNPLSYTDPSGYLFKKLNKALGKFAPFLSVAMLFVPGFQGWATANLLNAAASGFVLGGIASGSLKGALVGAFTGAAFHQIGQHFSKLSAANELNKVQGLTEFGGNMLTSGQIASQITAHAVAGGVASSLQGGKFGHGFFSAGFTKAIGTPLNDRLGHDVVAGTATSAIIGGTASKIAGGKFANGAITGAFQALYNHYSKSAIPEWRDTGHEEKLIDYLDYEWASDAKFRFDFPGEINFTVEGQLPALRGPMGMPIGPGIEAKWYHTRLIKDTLTVYRVHGTETTWTRNYTAYSPLLGRTIDFSVPMSSTTVTRTAISTDTQWRFTRRAPTTK